MLRIASLRQPSFCAYIGTSRGDTFVFLDLSECFDLIYRRFHRCALWIWECSVFLGEVGVEGRSWSTFFTSASGIAYWINPVGDGSTFRVKFLCQIIKQFPHFANILPDVDTVVASATSASQSVLHPESTECGRPITGLVEWWKCWFVQDMWHLRHITWASFRSNFQKQISIHSCRLQSEIS